MKKIFITGCGGYIGSITSRFLLEHGLEVIGVDNFLLGKKEPLDILQKTFGQNKFRYYERDIHEDMSDIFEKERKIDIVIHFAASSNVNESVSNPEKYRLNNLEGTKALLKSMKKNKISKLIFSSTAAVYGESKYLPIDEEHPTHPTNPYGKSKLQAEKYIQSQPNTFKYIIFRYFNVCGASEDGLFGDSRQPSTALMQNAIRGVLDITPFFLTCPNVDTKDKTPIRDYLNVIDLAQAQLLAINYLLKGGDSEIINLGGEEGRSVLEVVKSIENIIGKKINFKQARARKGECAEVVASIQKAKKILNWSPQTSLDSSVQSLLAWYENHPHGWKY